MAQNSFIDALILNSIDIMVCVVFEHIKISNHAVQIDSRGHPHNVTVKIDFFNPNFLERNCSLYFIPSIGVALHKVG
jgi:hypothetical protein